eukprot:3855693-Rhodomonas_salina.1
MLGVDMQGDQRGRAQISVDIYTPIVTLLCPHSYGHACVSTPLSTLPCQRLRPFRAHGPTQPLRDVRYSHSVCSPPQARSSSAGALVPRWRSHTQLSTADV